MSKGLWITGASGPAKGFARHMSVTYRRLAGCLALAAAITASVGAGTPTETELPEIALGWPALLHVERAAAMIGLVALIGLIWWRASKGELPIRFGNIEYAAADATTALDGRVALLELATEKLTRQGIDPLAEEP